MSYFDGARHPADNPVWMRVFTAKDRVDFDNFTLEEILQYLDSKGYNVDISIKGLQPLEMPESADQE